MRFLLFTIPLLFSQLLWASPSINWQFVKAEDGITLHTRPHSGGLVEIRAQMFIATSYSGFLLLLEDTENVPKWIDNVAQSRVLRQISPTENIVYTQFEAPWPALDRDMVTYSRYIIENGSFTLFIEDAPNVLTEQSDYIRITDVKALWTLEKLTNGLTHVEYVAFANPSGALPDWLVNKLAISSALKTFQGLRTNVKYYQDLSHTNINKNETAVTSVLE
jgi:hypothetical protein